MNNSRPLEIHFNVSKLNCNCDGSSFLLTYIFGYPWVLQFPINITKKPYKRVFLFQIEHHLLGVLDYGAYREHWMHGAVAPLAYSKIGKFLYLLLLNLFYWCLVAVSSPKSLSASPYI